MADDWNAVRESAVGIDTGDCLSARPVAATGMGDCHILGDSVRTRNDGGCGSSGGQGENGSSGKTHVDGWIDVRVW